MSSGTDTTGVFGSDTDLTGKSVTMIFEAQTTHGTRTETDNRLDAIGGYFYPAAGPIDQAVINVGGINSDHIIDYPIFSEYSESTPPGTFGDYSSASISQSAENQPGTLLHFDSAQAFLSSARNGQVAPAGFDAPFYYFAGPGDIGSATFTIFARNTTTGAIVDDATGSFTPTFSQYFVAGGPEPTSWAMMIAGFGLAGMAMRRRERRLSQA